MAAPTILGRRMRFPRIPVFRVFYSLTYTLLYLIALIFLAITPITMIYASIQQQALQYTVMIGAGYVLTATIAIFVYSSRLYTNRSTLSGIGKAYIPIEHGEIGGMVRKMIVKQLERSAIVAWESRPRDLYGEILLAEQEGILPPESRSVSRNDYTVGTEIPVDPQRPPWGDVQHPGWSSPSRTGSNQTPDVQFDSVIAELPHLVEARAVSLAPPDPTLTPISGEPRAADHAVADILKRPANMALREYLTQLSYLGLVQPPKAQNFLSQYERARFSGKPVRVEDFNSLMSAFAELLAGMLALDIDIVDEIKAQTAAVEPAPQESPLLSVPINGRRPALDLPSSPIISAYSAPSEGHSPVTAREWRSSHVPTTYSRHDDSTESLGSLVLNLHDHSDADFDIDASDMRAYRSPSFSSSIPSDPGSVLRHDVDSHYG